MSDSLRKSQANDIPLLALFSDIGRSLTSTRTLEEVLSVIMEKVSSLLNPRNWSLLLLDQDTRDLVFEIAIGKGSEGLVGRRLALGKGIAGWVAEKGEPLLIGDAQNDTRFFNKFDQESHFNTQSIVCVPIKSKGNVLGVIELINIMSQGQEPDRLFTPDDLDRLTILADFAAIAIENARYIERIQNLIVTDDVTGLYNSRYMNDILDREVARSDRYHLEFSLVFMDLDHFKSVNDTHGHLVGSRVLRETAMIIRKCLRDADVPIRYGGDEFVILLPETGKANGQVVTERIRKTLAANEFLSETGERFFLTSSLGLASYPEDHTTKLELIRLADQALYRAKETGRNRTIVAQPSLKKTPDEEPAPI